MISFERRGASHALPININAHIQGSPTSDEAPAAGTSFLSAFQSSFSKVPVEGMSAGVNTTAAIVIGITVPVAVALIVISIVLYHWLRRRSFRKGLDQRRKESLEKRLISHPVLIPGEKYSPTSRDLADEKVMGWYSGYAPINVFDQRHPFRTQPYMSEKELPRAPLVHGFRNGVKRDAADVRSGRSNRLSRWSGKTGEVKPELQVSPWDSVSKDVSVTQPPPTFLRPSSQQSSGSSVLSSLNEQIRTLQVTDENYTMGANMTVPFSTPTFLEPEHIFSPPKPTTSPPKYTASPSTSNETPSSKTRNFPGTTSATELASGSNSTSPSSKNDTVAPLPIPRPRPGAELRASEIRPSSSVYVPCGTVNTVGPVPANVLERADTLAKTYRQLVGAPPTPSRTPVPAEGRSKNNPRRTPSTPRRRGQRGVPLRIEIPKSDHNRPFARRGNV